MTQFPYKHGTGRASTFWWILISSVLGAELAMSYLMPLRPEWFRPWLMPLAELTSKFASVVRNFDQFAANVAALNMYFAATLWLLFPKAAFIYWWMNSRPKSNARYLMITPLTTEVAGGPAEFATANVHEHAAGPPRSMANRIFWSVLQVALAAAGCWAVPHWGFEAAKPSATLTTSLGFGAEVQDVLRMGVSLWIPWSVGLVPITAFFLAVATGVVRDSGIAVARRLR